MQIKLAVNEFRIFWECCWKDLITHPFCVEELNLLLKGDLKLECDELWQVNFKLCAILISNFWKIDPAGLISDNTSSRKPSLIPRLCCHSPSVTPVKAPWTSHSALKFPVSVSPSRLQAPWRRELGLRFLCFCRDCTGSGPVALTHQLCEDGDFVCCVYLCIPSGP